MSSSGILLHRHAILAIARYTALEAVRTRYVWMVAGLLFAGLGIAMFTGDLAITETRATQASITASLLRFAAAVLVILFVSSSVHRDFSDKSVELMLSLPLPRAGYYLGKLLGYALISAVTAAPLCLLMMLFAPLDAAILWGLSLLLELTLVCTLSLVFAFAFSQITTSIIASLLFYLLARSIAAIQLMAHGPLHNQAQTTNWLTTHLVDGLAYLLPDLDRFTRSFWLVYEGPAISDMALLASQTVVYLALLSGIALFDLYRKNF